jgi:hypothetical protein
VVVLGAGNVAMDSARTAMRLGADSVRIVYRRSRDEMPARGAEIHHAEEEGIEFFLLTNPTQFKGDEKGRLTGMECLKMELGEPDDSGRRRPIAIEGSEFHMDTDLVIVAVGSGANPLLTQSTTGHGIEPMGVYRGGSGNGQNHQKRGLGRRRYRYRCRHRHSGHGCRAQGGRLHRSIPVLGMVTQLSAFNLKAGWGVVGSPPAFLSPDG